MAKDGHVVPRDGAQDPVELMLRAVRTRALQSALLAALPMSACSPPGMVPKAMPSKPTERPPLQPSVAPPPIAVPERVQCDTNSNFPVNATNLQPIVPVDYLALRSASGIPDQGGPENWTQTQFEVLSQRGTPCSSAPAGSTCLKQVERHPVNFTNPQCLQICREISVVTTRAGDVRRWATAKELREFLAPIDTVDEALLLVQAEHYNVSCEAESTQARRNERGYEVYATRLTSTCSPMITTGYWLLVSFTGEVSEISSEERSRSEACVGRMPAGLAPTTPASKGDECAAFLAQSAYLEAASVLAFERLAEELAHHGAPLALVEAARRASVEEARHTRQVGALARAFGASELAEPALATLPVRSLESIALENAVEGCVRETFGAMVGAFQAVRAADSRVQRSMGSIADDELGHASLSFAVHAWLMPQLAEPARARIDAALREAIAQLASNVAAAQPETRMERELGLPSVVEARALLSQLQRDLWVDLLERPRC
ncbi:MAG: hypothetical protein QM778_15225 [Myxococcales bacterium]